MLVWPLTADCLSLDIFHLCPPPISLAGCDASCSRVCNLSQKAAALFMVSCVVSFRLSLRAVKGQGFPAFWVSNDFVVWFPVEWR